LPLLKFQPSCVPTYLVFVVFFLFGDSPASELYMPTFRNTLFNFHRRCKREDSSCLYSLCKCNRHSVPKRRHIKFWRRGHPPS